MTDPIQLRPHRVVIEAPRAMVYQKMSSFGKGRLQGDNNESSKVISRDGDTLVAEFKTKAGPFSYTTIEEITLEKDRRITFKHLNGPLAYAWEEFVFSEVGNGDTELVHNGEFIWKRIPLLGRLAGRLYTKPVFERTIAKHLQQVKVGCEARAARSHVFRRKQTASSDQR